MNNRKIATDIQAEAIAALREMTRLQTIAEGIALMGFVFAVVCFACAMGA